jgi:hypothetical protein
LSAADREVSAADVRRLEDRVDERLPLPPGF